LYWNKINSYYIIEANQSFKAQEWTQFKWSENTDI